MEASLPNHFLAFCFTLLSFTFHNSAFAATLAVAPKASTEFIKTSCSKTTYPTLCFNSLSSHANAVQTSPKLLASTALSVTLATARTTSTMMSRLSQTHGMTPRDIGAVQDCLEVLGDSVQELSSSMTEMGQIKSNNFKLTMSDVQTWVSAALTDDTTCTDGFDGNAMNGNVKTVVRGKVLNIAHLTSNALALINSYASSHQ